MKKKSTLKYKFIRKYEIDCWGYLTSCLTGKRFFKKMFKIFSLKNKYRYRIIKALHRKPYIKFNYSRAIPYKVRKIWYTRTHIVKLRDILKFRVYYGDMTTKKLRKYLQKINTRRVDFEVRLCFLLESRLDILLFRLNFVKSPREARQYIECKKIFVNDKIVNRLNYQLYLHDIIHIERNLSIFFLKTLCNKLEKNEILFNSPKYIEINYNLMKWMFISYPRRKYIPSTWKIDFSFLRNFIS